MADKLQALQRREQLIVDEIEQRLPGDALRVRRPVAPLEFLRDRRAIAVLGQFEFLILIVDDLEEEHPAQLADALRIAIDAHVLAHDVLNGFDGGADDHGSSGLLIERVLHLVDGLFEALLAAERLDELHDAAHRGEGRHLQHIGVVEIEYALVAILFQQRIEHGAGLRRRIW